MSGLARAIRAEGDRLEVAGLLDDREAAALAAAVRDHLAALAADEQVRERVLTAVRYRPACEHEARWKSQHGIDTRCDGHDADAAVAAFLAAAEEEGL